MGGNRQYSIRFSDYYFTKRRRESFDFLEFRHNMKSKKFILILLILLTVIISLKFTIVPYMSYVNLPKPLPTVSPFISSVNVKDIPKKNQANAYYEIFKDLCKNMIYIRSGYSDMISPTVYDDNYFVLDLSDVIYDDASNLIALFMDYCDKSDYIFLMDTFDGLKEKRYIDKFSYFNEGFIIKFTDKEIYKNSLVINAIFQNGHNFSSCTYMVELINGEWQITDKWNEWTIIVD